jgi:hypothetical protein
MPAVFFTSGLALLQHEKQQLGCSCSRYDQTAYGGMPFGHGAGDRISQGFHATAGAVEPLWWTVAAAAKKERSTSIVHWNVGIRRTLVLMEPQPRAKVALVLGYAVVAGLIVTIAWSLSWQQY